MGAYADAVDAAQTALRHLEKLATMLELAARKLKAKDLSSNVFFPADRPNAPSSSGQPYMLAARNWPTPTQLEEAWIAAKEADRVRQAAYDALPPKQQALTMPPDKMPR